MDNNTVARYGNLICVAVWLMESIGAFIHSLIDKDMPPWSSVALGIAVLAGVYLIGIADYKFKHGPGFKYAVFVILSTIVAYCIAIVKGGAFIIFMLFLLQWLICVFYMDRSLTYELASVQIFALVALFFPEMISARFETAITMGQFIIAVITVGLCVWISGNAVGLINLWQKNNANQRQSISDMLKVVETVCSETKASDLKKTDFIYSLSGNIMQQVRVMHSMNQMIASKGETGSIGEYSERMNEAEERLKNISMEITEYTQIEKAELTISTKRYDLGEVIEKLIKGSLRELNSRRLDLNVTTDSETPRYLVGDPNKILRALECVLSNSVRYTDRGKIELGISSIRNGDDISLRICIKDTGHGIRNRDRERIFLPFYRVVEGTAESEPGIGMGLYIAKGLLKAMDGSIFVSSEYGRGSFFYILLPQAVDRQNVENEKLAGYLESTIELLKNEGEKPDGTDGKNKGASPAVVSTATKDTTDGDGSEGEEFLPKISGIDWKAASVYLPEKDILIDTLKDFCKSGYDNADSIRKYKKGCAAGDKEALSEFRIKIHAIKGNLKMIGADELAEYARKLEYAAKGGEVSVIEKNADDFTDRYVSLINDVGKIPEIAADREIIKKHLDSDNALKLMDRLVEAMQDFETDTADRLMSDIENYDYDDETVILVKELSSLVLNLDLDGVREKVSEIGERLKT